MGSFLVKGFTEQWPNGQEPNGDEVAAQTARDAQGLTGRFHVLC